MASPWRQLDQVAIPMGLLLKLMRGVRGGEGGATFPLTSEEPGRQKQRGS